MHSRITKVTYKFLNTANAYSEMSRFVSVVRSEGTQRKFAVTRIPQDVPISKFSLHTLSASLIIMVCAKFILIVS